MRDFIVKILVKLGLYKNAVSIINYFKAKSQARTIKRYGIETLREADAALTEVGHQMFLIFGTLLGAVREHGFIPFDYDLDVGIVADGPSDEIHSAMKKHGLKLTRTTYIRTEKGEWVTEETYHYKGVGIDLYFFFEDGSEWYAFGPKHHEYKDWKEANATDGFPTVRAYVPQCKFERQDFMGVQVYMPIEADAWCRALYTENYMIPIKNWDPKKHQTSSTRYKWTGERCYRRDY